MSIVGALPNTISNGQSIDAVPVMNNLNWLMNQVNSNAAGLTQANTFSQVQSGVPATGLANFLTASQIINQNLIWCGTATGTDTISITSIIAPLAYSAGQVFRFLSAGANTTTSVTLNVDGLGAKSVLKANGGSLNIGDIPASAAVEVQYTGAVFHVLSPITPGLGVTTPGTAEASKAVVLDASKNISGIGNITGGSIDATHSVSSGYGVNIRKGSGGIGAQIFTDATGVSQLANVYIDSGNVFNIGNTTSGKNISLNTVGSGTVIINGNTVRHDGNTFHGRVQSTGTAIRLPAGWSSSRLGIGSYRITHNLGTANYTAMSNPSGAFGPTSSITTQSTNSFDLTTYNPSTFALQDSAFNFDLFMD